MTRSLKIRSLKILSVALACVFVAGAAQAEVAKVRVSRQFGLPYLPMIVIEAQHLLEKNAKALGVDVEAEWSQRAGPAAERGPRCSGCWEGFRPSGSLTY